MAAEAEMSFWIDDLDVFFSDFGVEASFRKIATIAIGAGGTGYHLNDVLTLGTPTNGIAATAKVTGVTAGVVTEITLLTPGAGYTAGLKATTVAPAGGANCTIKVLTLVEGFDIIFHNAYEAAVLFNGAIESRDPYCEVKDSDVATVVHDTVLWIDSVAYKIKEIKPDGTGITVLILSKD
jgi:hypothetical protein